MALRSSARLVWLVIPAVIVAAVAVLVLATASPPAPPAASGSPGSTVVPTSAGAPSPTSTSPGPGPTPSPTPTGAGIAGGGGGSGGGGSNGGGSSGGSGGSSGGGSGQASPAPTVPTSSPTPTPGGLPGAPYVVKQVETLGGEAISGIVCNQSRPFTVAARTSKVAWTFVFTPEGTTAGKVSYAYSIPSAGESHRATGTYRISAPEHNGTLHLSLTVSDHVVFKGFDGNIPVHYKFDLVPTGNGGCPTTP
jgi:hypothetical protein